jgi:hypothetical protein
MHAVSHEPQFNTFLPSGADLQQLTDAFNINDQGEIASLGIPPGYDDEFSCGRVFVLLPCEDEDRRDESCKGGDTEASADTNDDASTSSVISANFRLTPSELRERVRANVYGQNRRSMGCMRSSGVLSGDCSVG